MKRKRNWEFIVWVVFSVVAAFIIADGNFGAIGFLLLFLSASWFSLLKDIKSRIG